MAHAQPVVQARADLLQRLKEQEKLIKEKMGKVKYKIIVLSGKGGVGKSFVTASLAFALAARNRRVGILDADVHGPSIPRMVGVTGKRLYASPTGSIIPVEAPLGIKVVSIEFMLPSQDTPVIWRGPMKTAALRELLANVEWGELDYLLVDLPPGTGDEQLTIVQLIPDITGAIIVTMPSLVSRDVVEKAVNFAKRLNVRILGIIENMSYFVCPDGSVHYIFGRGAGEEIARKEGITLLGKIPIDPRISSANDEGVPFFLKYPDTPAAKAFLEVAEKVISLVEASQAHPQ